MKPVNDYIIINELNEEIQTESGLLLASDDVNNLRYKKGRVVSSAFRGIRDGNVIYYDKSAGHPLMVEGQKVTVIRGRDVVVVV